MELDGSVAIVTGAGQGIGRAIALELAHQGAALCIADLNDVNAETVTNELRSLGCRAIAHRVDVAKKQQVDEMVNHVIAEFGRVNVMVNNAGVGHVKPLLEITEEEWDFVFSIHTKGVLFGIQAAARAMIAQKTGGRIINIASVGGKEGRPMLATYAASKAAVINLTQSAACALAGYKITVNCICPGVTKTALGNSQLSKLKEYSDSGKVSVELSRVPPALLGPTASPKDIARMVAYLTGIGGAYITGQSINIDGGRVMH